MLFKAIPAVFGSFLGDSGYTALQNDAKLQKSVAKSGHG
jgi:hypothetical protein